MKELKPYNDSMPSIHKMRLSCNNWCTEMLPHALMPSVHLIRWCHSRTHSRYLMNSCWWIDIARPITRTVAPPRCGQWCIPPVLAIQNQFYFKLHVENYMLGPGHVFGFLRPWLPMNSTDIPWCSRNPCIAGGTFLRKKEKQLKCTRPITHATKHRCHGQSPLTPQNCT